MTTHGHVLERPTLARRSGEPLGVCLRHEPPCEDPQRKRASRMLPTGFERPDPPFLRRAARTPRGPKGRVQVAVLGATLPKRRAAEATRCRNNEAPRSPLPKQRGRAEASPVSFSLRAPPVADAGSNAGLECPFEILTGRRAPTLRRPAKGDGCSTSEVLSTARNQRARGIAPAAFAGRLSFHSIHPFRGGHRPSWRPKTPERWWESCGEKSSHAFFTARFRSISTASSDAPCREAPCGAPTRSVPRFPLEGSSRHRAARTFRTGTGNGSPTRPRLRRGSRPFGLETPAAPVTASTTVSARGTDVPRTSRSVMHPPPRLRKHKTTYQSFFFVHTDAYKLSPGFPQLVPPGNFGAGALVLPKLLRLSMHLISAISPG